MQQKRHRSRLVIFLIGLSFILVGGLGALMVMDVPSPAQPIEKTLDAKAFLSSKE